MSNTPNLEFFPENDYISENSPENLVVNVDGFEGPLDMLLTLSRTQKVDLLKISISQLASQYLDFVAKAKELRIELAADYLVMAAWLAFLKSRLLLPADPNDDGPTGEELSAILAFRLERLQAMRNAGAKLIARNQLGKDFFSRGIPETLEKNYGIQGFENLFRYRIGVEKKIKLKPINLEFRAAYQNRFSLDRDNRFKKRLRFRPTVEYKIKDWSNNPKIYLEYLKELEGSKEQSFRYGISSKLNFDDLKSITLRYFFQKSKIDLGSISNWHVISLKYSFSKDI